MTDYYLMWEFNSSFRSQIMDQTKNCRITLIEQGLIFFV